VTHQTLTLNIPDHLYQWLEQWAEQTHQSIEEAALNMLASVASEDEGLSGDLKELLEAMTQLPDEALWDAARNSLAREATEKLRRLHARHRRQGLSLAEWQRQDDLLRQYDRGILIRSQALLLLKQRGHDISSLLQPV
jgi:hypothetical protein